jgi:DNA-binding CsgD family transcriptional regulator/tetratricopeptide (TPR) repeat protein
VVELLERADELAVLAEALESCRAGPGGLVVVEAEPGMGKTELLQATARLATDAGMPVLRARGAPIEREFAFGAVQQLFEPLLAHDAELLSGAAAAALPVFQPVGHGDAGDSRVLRGLYALMASVAAVPVVVIVDDLQWVDESSLRFLGFLARRLGALPVALVVAGRAGEIDIDPLITDVVLTGGAALLAPSRLSPSAVTTMVRDRLGDQVDDRFCQRCHSATGGNPLFVRELLRFFAADPARPRTAEAVVAAGPGAVSRHVAARLRLLSGNARAVATAIAVLGDGAETPIVAACTGLGVPDVLDALDVLATHSILEQGRIAFVHALVRDAVLALVTTSALDAAHEKAALVLAEAGASPARIASHLLRTMPKDNPMTVVPLLAAADEVRRRGSPESAAVFLERAVAEPPAPDYRSEVRRSLGNCLAYRMDFPAAEKHLRTALTLAVTPDHNALAAFSLARFRNACGAPAEGVRILADALAAWSEEISPRLAVRLEVELLGLCRAAAGHRAMFVRHLGMLRNRPQRPQAVIDTHDALESILDGGAAGPAVEQTEKALAAGLPSPDNSPIWTALNTLMVADRNETAARHLHGVLEHCTRLGLLVPLAMTHAYLARIAWQTGDLPLARAHVDRGLEAAPGGHFALPLLHAAAAHLLLDQGRTDEAGELLAAGALVGGRLPHVYNEMWLLHARARWHADRGDPSSALADARAAGRLYDEWGGARILDTPWRIMAADALTALGQQAAAAELVEEHLVTARAFGVPRHEAVGLAAAARLAAPGDGLGLTRQAVTLLTGSSARLDLARALFQLGLFQERAGQRTEGRQSLLTAAELAATCGATHLEERVRGRLAARGGRPARIHSVGAAALTPAEREVATLAAGGLTNRRIAARLFVTEKTVEAHLSRIYRKLQVRSRAEIAAMLGSDG